MQNSDRVPDDVQYIGQIYVNYIYNFSLYVYNLHIWQEIHGAASSDSTSKLRKK